MRSLITMVAMFGCYAVAASGQSPAEALKGTWVAESTYCGKSIYKIDSVDANGTVHGTFTCTNTKWIPTIGEVINRNAVKGTLTGNRFVMVNLDGGGSDLVLNGDKLEGTGSVRSSSARSTTTYTRQ